MYNALGIDKFYDIESYKMGEGQAVNWGMKDIPFFEQSVEHDERNATTILFKIDYINKPPSI